MPNWLFGGAVNLALMTLTGGSAYAAGGFLRKLASTYGKRAAATMFSSQLKSSLIRKGIAASIASGVCTLAGIGFEVLYWTTDPGNQLAKFIDARDCRANNGWVDIS
ncbi:hypothetical protein [Clostridium sp. UBA4548]|uniref:hypothetical protein n=1 Tax=Clostridium sp. UBA4548 TaxID=1946361 RepID=UPI0025BE6A87|nr:hypothetical protein [Clostridium sp. UBA4548]